MIDLDKLEKLRRNAASIYTEEAEITAQLIFELRAARAAVEAYKDWQDESAPHWSGADRYDEFCKALVEYNKVVKDD